jgi:hypothetical protein
MAYGLFLFLLAGWGGRWTAGQELAENLAGFRAAGWFMPCPGRCFI